MDLRRLQREAYCATLASDSSVEMASRKAFIVKCVKDTPAEYKSIGPKLCKCLVPKNRPSPSSCDDPLCWR
jgi:hypothetical protein